MRSMTVALLVTLSSAIYGTFSPAGADPMIVSPVSSLATTEEGRAASFTVSLAAQPVANVVINLVSTDTGEGTVSPASLTFTPTNWSSRTVSVTGQPDSLADGDIAYSIQTSLQSSDPQYSSINPPDVALVNFDEDGDRDGDGLIDVEDPDDDGDGVDDLTENDAPHNGDGNADGTPDSLQAQVASFRSSTDKSFLTLEAGTCAGGFFNVRALTEDVVGEADSSHDYPFGLVLFRLSCSSADVTLWFSQGGRDIALVWNFELEASATATSSVKIVVIHDPIDGLTLQSTILMDADGVDGNETLSLTDDPNQSKSVDPTPVSQ